MSLSSRRLAIERIARRTRAWAERVQQTRNPDNEFCEDLGGMCAIASMQLHRQLVGAGISATLAASRYHCFVIVTLERRRHVVDITATQFGKEAVFIRPLVQASSVAEWWKPSRLFSQRPALREYLSNAQWPSSQINLAAKR